MIVRFEDAFTVDEAAARLGVSHRRLGQLLATGEIAGERFGRQWLIPAAEIERVSVRLQPVGRPFGERLSWAILAALEGRPVPARLAREERARVSRYVSRPFSELAPRLRGRAERRPLILGAAALEGVTGAAGWVVGGARALRLVGSATASAVDLYLPADSFEVLLDGSLGVPDAAFPNLVAHLVERRYWPYRDGDAFGWTSASLLDLFEAGTIAPTSLNEVHGRLVRARGDEGDPSREADTALTS